jgi:PAS domain S-box-containing protein
MFKSKAINFVFGFIGGLILLVIVYISIFFISDFPFTFNYLFELHKSIPLLVFIDVLPFIGIFVVYLFYRVFSSIIAQKDRELSKERFLINTSIKISENLSKGQYNNKLVDDQGELLHSLYQLQSALKEKQDLEKSRINEDKRRNWVSEGIASFGEILRIHSDDMENLSYQIISKLVKYLDANQGGFFLVQKDKKDIKFFNLLACYAYDRKKFADRKINWGEGLIGSCALEKKIVYMTDVPKDYLLITSGLGKSTPNNLLIVPLISNDEVKGIIEIASFQPFEKFEIDFLEKVAESIAMTLENIQNSLKTTLLLKETQAQADELSVQEERMRQNMEELKATQEQAARQAEKFISFTNSVNHTLIRAEYDKDGILLYANTKFLKKLGYSGNREVEGKHISYFIHKKDQSWFNEIWHSLSLGGRHFEGYMKHISKQGQDVWTMATYTCVRKDDGNVEKILFLAIDTTEHKKQSLDYEAQLEAINRLNLKAEFAPEGRLIYANDLFINTLKLQQAQMDQLSVFDFFNKKDLENYTELWEKVIVRKAYQGQIRLLTRFDEEKWFRASFTAVEDMYSDVAKVIFLANEITNEKLMEEETYRKTEILKEQEEKLRLSSFELKKQLEETEKNWQLKLENTKTKLSTLNYFLNENELIILSVDNNGLLLFMNSFTEKYFKVKAKRFIDKPAISLLGNNPENFPSFFQQLFDPSLPKNFKHDSTVQLTNKKTDAPYHLSFKTMEAGSSMIYNVMLRAL